MIILNKECECDLVESLTTGNSISAYHIISNRTHVGYLKYSFELRQWLLELMSDVSLTKAFIDKIWLELSKATTQAHYPPPSTGEPWAAEQMGGLMVRTTVVLEEGAFGRTEAVIADGRIKLQNVSPMHGTLPECVSSSFEIEAGVMRRLLEVAEGYSPSPPRAPHQANESSPRS